MFTKGLRHGNTSGLCQKSPETETGSITVSPPFCCDLTDSIKLDGTTKCNLSPCSVHHRPAFAQHVQY